MPILVILLVAFVLWMALRGDDAPELPSDPPLVEAPKIDKSQALKKGAVKRESLGGIEGLLKLGATSIAASMFSSEASQIVATVGWTLAITIGAINIFAALIIWAVVYIVATILDFASQLNDFSTDRSSQARADFFATRSKVIDRFKDAANVQAGSEGTTPVSDELELAANAYADGFMEWSNWLRLETACYRGIWQGQVDVLLSKIERANRAYRTGFFAAEQPPQQNNIVSEAAVDNDHLNVSGYQFDRGLLGQVVLYTTPKVLNAATPYYNNYYGYAAFINSDERRKSAELVSKWYRIGMAHANTAGFMERLKRGNIALTGNVWQNLRLIRLQGFFHGAIAGPPDVPSGYGVKISGFTFYTPDNEKVVFTEEP